MITFINIDVSLWRDRRDVYETILLEIKAYPGHAVNINALVETLTWGGPEFSEIQPPFVIRLHNTRMLSPELLESIRALKGLVDECGDIRCHHEGKDLRSEIQIL